ncbi:MAG: hypothetical protein V1699_04510 [Candidatus Omnitrophota bacterium]
MPNKRLYRLIVILSIFFCLGITGAHAFDDGFSQAKKMESKHFTIYYKPQVDLWRLAQELNVSPSDELLAGKATKEGASSEAGLVDMLDTLFTKVCDILDMRLYSFKGTIKICEDSRQLNSIYHQVFNKAPTQETRSFYAYAVNTIYTSVDNFKLVIVGHEIGHAIISHYFVVQPSVKIQELLAAYVEFQLRKTAK